MVIGLYGSMPLVEAQSLFVCGGDTEEDVKGSNTVPRWLKMERLIQDPVYPSLYFVFLNHAMRGFNWNDNCIKNTAA